MRIVICPDSFGGTLSAYEAAQSMAVGLADHAASADLVLRPLSDGGPGFVSAIATAIGGELRVSGVHGPLGDPVSAQWLLADGVAYVEAAECVGRQLLESPAPMVSTSFGLGELLNEAAKIAKRVVVGIGGTCSSDGGAGLLAALSGRVFDPLDPLCQGAAGLPSLTKWPVVDWPTEVELVVATDVAVPLAGSRGAAQGFAPQKGASPEQVQAIEVALMHWAGLASGRRPDPALMLGAGAGGGIGFALLAIGGSRVAGAEQVFAATEFEAEIADADLVVTGEGRLDWQTAEGKLVAQVARLAAEHAKPVVVLAGEVELTKRECQQLGIAAAYSLVEWYGRQAAEQDPAATLRLAAARLGQTWV